MTPSRIAIVCIHGAGLSSSIWHKLSPLPNVRFYHLEFIGRGDPKTINYSLQEYEAFLIQQLNVITEQRIILVGHSLGGIFLLKLSQALGTRLIGIVAMSAMIPEPGSHFFSCLPFPQRIIMPVITSLFGTKVPESAIRSSLCADLTEADTTQIVTNFTPESRRIYLTPIHYVLPNVPKRFLIFTKDADFAVRDQKKMAERLHAPIVEIQGGHLAMLSQPEAVSSALNDFILSL